MNPTIRNFALWVVIAVLLMALFTVFQNSGQRQSAQEIPYSQLLSDVDQGHIRDVTLTGQDITGHFQDGRSFSTVAPLQTNGLADRLYAKNVSITAKAPSEGS